MRGPVIAALVMTSAVAVVWLLLHGAANTATVHVRNDTGAWVRIASCVDAAKDVGPGGEFDAHGVQQGSQLVCLVTSRKRPGRCVVIPRARSAHGTVALSRLRTVRFTRCY
jgi:hypothetical protein